MGKIFIRKLKIQNYKCFENEAVDFSVPDGRRGGGLNILIGENGNGKTAILEAVNYLTLNSFSAKNRLEINNFTDFKKEIVIEAETEKFPCVSSIDFYKDWIFSAEGIRFSAKSRNIKERGKLLSSTFQTNSYFQVVQDQYEKNDGSPRTDREGNIKNIDGRDKKFENARIGDNDELNIFFFDKNRSRQITTGNYKTTFEKICDDLNWNFVKNLDEEKIRKNIESIAGEYFKNVQEVTNKSVGKKTSIELKEFFDQDDFKEVKIELINLLHPFSNSFFALRKGNSLVQVNVRDLGSGIEIVLTLLILKNIAGVSKGSIIYLIDEPELHLHPRAQEKLLELLLVESKDKQIIVSTHSPYLFKGAISQNAKLILFTRNAENNIQITDARDKGWGLFPNWSPSWGEINYFAYDMPTVEFHNELYGYLESEMKGKLESLKKDRQRRNLLSREDEEVSLPEYIRHAIHHPENRENEEYSNEEFIKSIKLMIDLIRS